MVSAGALKGTSALSGILGLGVIVVSAILVAQSADYKNQLSYLFGYDYPSTFGNYNNNRYTYNIFGYELDPIIGISAGGVLIGFLQVLGCFLLCCGKRRRNLAIGWAVLHVVLLIGLIACFALSFYFYAYYRKTLQGYAAFGSVGPAPLDLNSNFLGNANFGNNIYAQNGFGIYNNAGLRNNLYDSTYGAGVYRCNPAGQAYCAVLGIDLVFVLVAIFVVGCSTRKEYEDYPADQIQKGYGLKH
jgi:hypothetical protein